MPFIHLLILLFKWLSGSSRERKHDQSQREAQRRVRVLDPATNKVTSMAVWELPPGMVRVTLHDVGEVWAKAGVPNPDGALHPPFPPAAQEVVRGIKVALEEVHPRTLAEWETELRGCARPEVEVARWLLVADVYTLCTRGRGLAPQARRDYFNVICACSVLGREEALESAELHSITETDAQEAAGLYFNHRG